MDNKPSLIKAKLFISTNCPHCASVMQHVMSLIKTDEISDLQICNIAQQTELAKSLSIRSVPLLLIEDQKLSGSQSLEEIRHWIKVKQNTNDSFFQVQQLINNQKLADATQIILQQPDIFSKLLALLGNLDTPMGLRIGIGAIIEDIAEQAVFTDNLQPLIEQLSSKDLQVRMDACYYLGLSQNPDLTRHIKPLLNDPNPDMQEIAQEALEQLK